MIRHSCRRCGALIVIVNPDQDSDRPELVARIVTEATTKHHCPPSCSVDGCDRDAAPKRAGKCERHYRADLAARQPPCTVDGCQGPAHTRGMCQAHYTQHLRRRARTEPPNLCQGCGKPIAERFSYCNRTCHQATVADAAEALANAERTTR